MYSTPRLLNMFGSTLIVRCATRAFIHLISSCKFVLFLGPRFNGHTDPYFYIPKTAFEKGALENLDSSTKKPYWLARLSAAGKSTDRVLVFDDAGPLKDLVRIEVSALGLKSTCFTFSPSDEGSDGWFVEDEKLLGTHPKDPYKRVECIPSSREVRIEVDGVVLAKSSQNIFLFETMLRPRYYLATTSVDWKFLSESKTTSYCPYKGMAK
jgi:uncharacterized protein (DUF427 family)